MRVCLEKSLSDVYKSVFTGRIEKYSMLNLEALSGITFKIQQIKCCTQIWTKSLSTVQHKEQKFKGEMHKSDSRGHVFNPTEKYLSAVPESF